MDKLEQNLRGVGILWAGDQGALQAMLQQEAQIQASVRAGTLTPTAQYGGDDDEELYPVVNGTAFIAVSGPLWNVEAWYDSLIGRTSYPALRRGLITAAQDDRVQRIVLLVNSPGGAALGIADVSSLIVKIGQRKNIVTFTNGTMASAAYWLGSQTHAVIATPTSLVGNIGTATTFVSQKRMMEEIGLDPLIIRAGEFKQKPHPYEGLDDAGMHEMQTMVDDLNDLFTSGVKAARNVSAGHLKSISGEGRTFVGPRAKEVRLVDHVLDYDDAIGAIMRGDFDKHADKGENTLVKLGANMSHLHLSSEQIAALQAAGLQVDTSTATVNTTVASAAPESGAAAPETPPAAPAVAAAPAEEPAATVTPAEPAAMTASNDYEDRIVDLKVELKTAQAELVSAQALIEPMRAVVEGAVAGMRVAMGLSAVDMKDMTAASLVAEHGNLSKQFKETFPSGRVSATVDPAEQGAPKGNEGLDPGFADRLARVSSISR